MKRTVVFLFMALLLLFPACKTENAIPSPTETMPSSPAPQTTAVPGLSINKHTENDDSKRLYIETEYFDPFIYPDGSVERKLADALYEGMDEMVKWIKDEEQRFPATDENSISYGLYSFITIAEDSDDFLSVYVDYNMYTGGAHGNLKRVSYVYRRTGQRLSEFDDVLAPGYTMSDIEEEVNRQMKEMTEEQGPMFYEDSVDFDDLYFPPDFYIKDDGLVVYFQTYEIGPYASGIPEFTMPDGYMKNSD